jgi:hypothetical protein
MANSQFVRDAMVPAVQLDANATIGETLRTFDQRKVLFGVVSDKWNRPLTIFIKERLVISQAKEPAEVLTVNVPYPLSIELHERLDLFLQAQFGDFALNQNFIGIVVQEQGIVQGVLLREIINQQALSLQIPVPLERSPVCLGIVVQELGDTQNILLSRLNSAHAQSMLSAHSLPVAPLRSFPLAMLSHPHSVTENPYLPVPDSSSSISAARLPGTGPGLLYRCNKCPGNPQCLGVRLPYYNPNYPPKCPHDQKREMKRVLG